MLHRNWAFQVVRCVRFWECVSDLQWLWLFRELAFLSCWTFQVCLERISCLQDLRQVFSQHLPPDWCSPILFMHLWRINLHLLTNIFRLFTSVEHFHHTQSLYLEFLTSALGALHTIRSSYHYSHSLSSWHFSDNIITNDFGYHLTSN